MKETINNNNFNEYVKKSMQHYGKSREETLQNKIVQEVAKSYAAGGCNHRQEGANK